MVLRPSCKLPLLTQTTRSTLTRTQRTNVSRPTFRVHMEAVKCNFGSGWNPFQFTTICVLVSWPSLTPVQRESKSLQRWGDFISISEWNVLDVFIDLCVFHHASQMFVKTYFSGRLWSSWMGTTRRLGTGVARPVWGSKTLTRPKRVSIKWRRSQEGRTRM